MLLRPRMKRHFLHARRPDPGRAPPGRRAPGSEPHSRLAALGGPAPVGVPTSQRRRFRRQPRPTHGQRPCDAGSGFPDGRPVRAVLGRGGHAVSGDYILSPSDTLEMNIFNEPSLTTQTRVAADGTVQFPLIGETQGRRDAHARGARTHPPQVQRGLPRRAAGVSQRDRLRGNATLPCSGRSTGPARSTFPGGEHLGLLEAIGLAGGFTRLANQSTVLIKRASPRGDQNLTVNVKKLNASGTQTFRSWRRAT